MPGPPDRAGVISPRMLLPILAILYVLGFTNLFLRSSFGVMAPDLAREMTLSPAMLSTVASAFFFSYALMQVPTGILLDRFGPRLTLSGMLFFTMAGTALFASATSIELLITARVLMGIGCAGVFTGAFAVMANWMPPARVVSQSGFANSFAAFGGLCATAPFAVLLAEIGWRSSYWLFTAFIALLMIGLAAIVRDRPPAHTPSPGKDESFGEVLRGVRLALQYTGMKRLLVTGLPISATTTITGVWGAPYLKDIHLLDEIARGNLLLMMAVCGMTGHILFGQVARRFNSVKASIVSGNIGVLCGTVLLAVTEHPPLLWVTAVFCLIGLSSAYPTVLFAHARGLVPAHLMGRGVSVINTGIMTAIAVVQLAFGWIIGLYPAAASAPPEHAYRVAFGALAIAALVALLIYLPVRDVKPKG